jgi:hypothetical protein
MLTALLEFGVLWLVVIALILKVWVNIIPRSDVDEDGWTICDKENQIDFEFKESKLVQPDGGKILVAKNRLERTIK